MKNSVSAYVDSSWRGVVAEVSISGMDAPLWYSRNTNIPVSMAKNATPVPMINRHIDGEMMKSPARRGLERITSGDGGSEARAIAAKVSIAKLTQSICVTVSGD